MLRIRKVQGHHFLKLSEREDWSILDLKPKYRRRKLAFRLSFHPFNSTSQALQNQAPSFGANQLKDSEGMLVCSFFIYFVDSDPQLSVPCS